jgi:protein gp37
MCRRFAGPWGLDPADPFKPTFHPERLDEPFRLKKPSRIFVGSMCDLFGGFAPIIMNAQIYGAKLTERE